ncbi:transposase [Streptomyces lydicus]|uniref:transposase n=1 Tax=Streptomyces lydicus TaxID=47763 RepID=UPI0036920A6E
MVALRAKWVLRSVARGSATVEGPLLEAAVDVRFEALRGVKAHGLTSVHGDEGVPAPPPRVGHTLYFGHRLEFAEIQCVEGLARDPCDGRGPAAGMSGERQGFHPSVNAGMQGRPAVGVDAERTVGAGHEAVGHGYPAVSCRERPAFCGQLLRAAGLGRSRGGLTTKLHLAVEQGQKLMSIVITAGQRGDSPQFEAVLEGMRVPRLGPGRPRTRPRRVRADKAYASAKNRAYLRRRGIRCTIPAKAGQAANRKKRGSRGGRPPKFDKADYKERDAVECGINRLKVRHEVAHVKWESHEGRRDVLTPD